MNILLSFQSHQCQLKEPSQQPLPAPNEGSVEEGEELPAQRYERDLVQKLKVLRHELSLQQPQAGHCRIEVSREEIFEVFDGLCTTNISFPYSSLTKLVLYQVCLMREVVNPAVSHGLSEL